MPFELKNARATYQRIATTLLHNLTHKETEACIFDTVIKSKYRAEHTPTILQFFAKPRTYRIGFGPQNYSFQATSEKVPRICG